MQAIRVHQFGEPNVLKLEEVPDPRPGPGQVVVRVRAVGVNPVETYIRAGKYGPRQFPFTPGADAAGVIDSVGEGVKMFKVGDRVYVAGSISGTYAQLALCEETKVHTLPEKTSFEAGAALGVPAATAYRALFHRAAAQPGETVLIHGATGGVGIFAVQFARAIGLTIIATGGSDKGRALVMREGAHQALDHHSPDYLNQLMKITADKGVDIIIEMLANVNLAKDLTVLAKKGRVIVVGNRGNIEINPRDTMARDADIRGMTLFNLNDAEYRSIHAAIGAALESNIIRPIIDETMPLAEAPRAHQVVLEGNSHGKIVLIP